MQTISFIKFLKLVELFAIDGFGCKFLAVCGVEI
jgi:hypothetical protein